MRARRLQLILFLVWLLTACAAPTSPPVVITASRAPLAAATALPTRTDAAHTGAPPTAASPVAPTPTPQGPQDTPTLTLSLFAEWDAPTAHALAWFPNGERLAVASARGVYIYDAATLQEQQFIDLGVPVYRFAISSDAHTLAAVTPDGLLLWDLRRGKRLIDVEAIIALQNTLGTPNSLAFSPDDRFLAMGQAGGVTLWNSATGILLHDWPQDNFIDAAGGQTIAFSHNSRLVATDHPYGISVWDVDSGALLHLLTTQRGGQPTHLAFSHDDRVLIAANGGHISFWEVATGVLRRERALAGFAAVTLSRDGLRLAGAGDGFIALSDSVTGAPWLRLMAHSGYASHFAYSPNGTRLAALDANSTLWVWQVDIGRVVATLDRHTPWTTTPALNPDGQTLAWGSGHRVWLWDYAGGEPPQPVFSQPDLVTSVAFSPDGQWLLTGGAAPSSRRAEAGTTAAARVWDLAASRLRDTLPSQGYAVSALAFSPDSQTIAVAGEDTLIRLWDLPSGQLLRELSGYQTSPIQLAFSPDGAQLLSLAAAYEGCYEAYHPGYIPCREERDYLRLWNVSRGTVSAVFGAGLGGCGNDTALFNPNGWQVVGSLCHNAGVLWSMRAGQARQRWRLPEPIGSLAFSPDSRFLAGLALDTGNVALINPDGGALIATAQPPDGPATWLTFLDNGRLLAWGHAHGAIRVWHARLTYPRP